MDQFTYQPALCVLMATAGSSCTNHLYVVGIFKVEQSLTNSLFSMQVRALELVPQLRYYYFVQNYSLCIDPLHAYSCTIVIVLYLAHLFMTLAQVALTICRSALSFLKVVGLIGQGSGVMSVVKTFEIFDNQKLPRE